MFKRILNFKPSLLTLLSLALILPPAMFLTTTFARAMMWRALADTGLYKIGHIAAFGLNLLVLATLLLLLRFAWNYSAQKQLWAKLLSLSAVLGIFFIYATLPANIRPLQHLIDDFFGKVFYLESVTPESFVKFKDTIDNAIFPPTKIFIKSGGGDAFAGIAIGHLIHEKQLDVEVIGRCHSSCANYLFPAGNRKVLNKNAIVMYHGNTLQANIVKLLNELRLVDGDITKLPTDLDLGIKGKEGSIVLNPPEATLTEPLKQVFTYLGWPLEVNELAIQERWAKAEEQFYEKLGIDQKIGIYGQIREYQAIYESEKYDGFYYSIEDMKKMGIKNIHVKDRPWQPELNPDAKRLYKVSL